MIDIDRYFRRSSHLTLYFKDSQPEQAALARFQLSKWLLNIPRDEDSTASLGNSIQCLKSKGRVGGVFKEQISSLKLRV